MSRNRWADPATSPNPLWMAGAIVAALVLIVWDVIVDTVSCHD